MTTAPAYIDRPAPTFEREDIRRHSAAGSYPPICLDDEHFLISQANLDALPEYSASKPTGVYDGKCWKIWHPREKCWWVACYIEEDPPHPDGMLTPYRRALVI